MWGSQEYYEKRMGKARRRVKQARQGNLAVPSKLSLDVVRLFFRVIQRRQSGMDCQVCRLVL
jgi:hypothetical protein